MKHIITAIQLIKKQVAAFGVPSVTDISKVKDPYLILISCILSLRTKDKTTSNASRKLFAVAKTPRKMTRLPASRIQKLIYPVGFYRIKAKVISELSKRILVEFNSKVPNTLEGLLSLKGVGRKTANLVLGLGYKIPSICVDTHVHRISNRLGWVKTQTPGQTEEALKKIIPRNHWITLNTLLVTFGQNICQPVSPYCGRCSVARYCKRVGVKRWR